MTTGAVHERARKIAELRVRRVISLSAGRRLRKLNAARRIPRQAWPRAARVAYTLALRQLLGELERAIERQWFPLLVRALPRLDAGASDITQLSIPDFVAEVIPKQKALQVARAAGERTAQINKGELNKQFRSVFGVEMLHEEPYLDKQLELFAVDNARLISALMTDVANAVQGFALKALRTTVPEDEVRRQVEARFDKARDSADGLSRDQVGKFNGELTKARQQSVGVDEYIWSTSKDERVRPGHEALEGTRQRWDEPPLTDPRRGTHAHPGEDPNCRCNAIPVMDDLLASLAG